MNNIDKEFIERCPEEHRKGLLLIEMLGLKLKDNQVQTKFGSKTPIGLYRSIIQAIED